MGPIADTYKAKDVEEVIDIFLYRPWGYALALGARKVRITPNQISVIGMGVGIIAGHLFFYDSLAINLVGIFFWMLGQALDGADGQLARMTNMRSQLGRMLDGISDNVKFASVYLHLGARLALEFDAMWPIAAMFASAITHSYQSAVADYYRNVYLYFVYDSGTAELEDPVLLRRQFEDLSWRKNPIVKFLLWGYRIYTLRQDRWAGTSAALQQAARDRFGDTFPDSLRELYRSVNRPLLRYYNALTTNTRMVVLYVMLITNQVAYFFAFELVLLNVLLIVMWAWRQPAANRKVRRFIDSDVATVPATG